MGMRAGVCEARMQRWHREGGYMQKGRRDGSAEWYTMRKESKGGLLAEGE